MDKITLKGKPVSTQHAYGQRGKIRYMKARARDLKEDYQWQAKQQWKGKPLTGDLAVDIKLFFDTNHRRDWDNWHKISMDSLEGIVFEDDSQIQKAIVEKCKGEPRIEIIINHV